MRVCFISHSEGVFGAEGAMLELVRALEPLGVKALVLVPMHGPIIDRLDSMGVEYRIIHFRWWVDTKGSVFRTCAKFLYNIILIPTIIKTLRAWGCDLVYTNTFAVWVGALCAKILGLPHVWHLHEFGLQDHGLEFDFGRGISCKAMGYLSSEIIVVSQAVRKHYGPDLPVEKINLIYQSVELKTDLPGSASANEARTGLRCGVIGRLQQGKGYLDVIEALYALRAEGMDISLCIAGIGNSEYEEVLRELVRQRGIDDAVKFMGFVDDPSVFYDSLDVLVVSSVKEAFGRVTVEAMLAGKAVVATNTGGSLELIKDNETGLLYESGNIESLKEKLKTLYESPEMRGTLGESARVWAQDRFTPQRYANEMHNVFNRLI